MLLSQLLEGIEWQGDIDTNTQVERIRSNINSVDNGTLFVAIKGNRTDASAYIPLALHLGASAVVCGKDYVSNHPKLIKVEDPRSALSVMSSNFYDKPAAHMHMIGVTGTNGKTTTSYMIRHILANAGLKTGLIGTIEACVGDGCEGMNNTTPEPEELFKILKKLKDNHCQSVVMEVSSQGLHQHRVDGIDFDIGVFTNISPEHLDYHKTMDSYLQSKLMLVPKCKKMLVNIDSDFSENFQGFENCRYYSLRNPVQYFASDIVQTLQGSSYTLKHGDDKYLIKLSIPGLFNVYNSLAAISACSEFGIPLSQMECLEYFQGVKGRMELVHTDTPYSVMIDFAHTPESLKQLLISTKQFVQGRIIIVFGCGGDRDRTKRPVMGRIASEFADYCIITSDNPRTEQPEKIIQQIVSGIRTTGNYKTITDRTEAIRYALSIAKKDDCVILAGKGHETYQLINGIKHHYDEREIIEDILK